MFHKHFLFLSNVPNHGYYQAVVEYSTRKMVMEILYHQDTQARTQEEATVPGLSFLNMAVSICCIIYNETSYLPE